MQFSTNVVRSVKNSVPPFIERPTAFPLSANSWSNSVNWTYSFIVLLTQFSTNEWNNYSRFSRNGIHGKLVGIYIGWVLYPFIIFTALRFPTYSYAVRHRLAYSSINTQCVCVLHIVCPSQPGACDCSADIVSVLLCTVFHARTLLFRSLADEHWNDAVVVLCGTFINLFANENSKQPGAFCKRNGANNSNSAHTHTQML